MGEITRNNEKKNPTNGCGWEALFVAQKKAPHFLLGIWIPLVPNRSIHSPLDIVK